MSSRASDDGLAPARRKIRLATGETIFYAIGDVHGCFDALRWLEDAIVADGNRFARPKRVVMLGDYVDRGPKSAQVLDHLLGAMPAGFERTCLCGNHEEQMLRFIEDPTAADEWLSFGSEATFRSYGLDLSRLRQLYDRDTAAIRDVFLETVPEEHVALLRSLPSMAVADDVVFVHAGLRPDVPLEQQRDEDLLWIRKPFLRHGANLPVFVVHGHTPTPEPIHENGRIGIDTGAFKTGRLTAIRLFDRHVHLLHTRPEGGVDVSGKSFTI